MDVKEIIKNRRIELGYTLDDIARKVGVSAPTVSRWERGEIANMKRDKIVKLADALQLSPAVIMGWEPPEPLPDLDPEVAQIAQELHDNQNLKILFDATKKATTADLKMVVDIVKRLTPDE